MESLTKSKRLISAQNHGRLESHKPSLYLPAVLVGRPVTQKDKKKKTLFPPISITPKEKTTKCEVSTACCVQKMNGGAKISCSFASSAVRPASHSACRGHRAMFMHM